MFQVLTRPPKNYTKFKYDDSHIYFPKQLFDGEAGQLPLFLVVDVGYDSEDDNHKYMEAFESGETLQHVTTASVYVTVAVCLQERSSEESLDS
ncbi:hypothetical protein C0Q70_07718 [Pomacea canaliculata]|uniref:Uncharacterized protein n=1 Tax=Pomacea canaliculata TaxID=400727 RepID=A0A2T7PFT3_POMCA|nr:hypothetical protein C0Q70_07718 [Pomacea canaliculata]